MGRIKLNLERGKLNVNEDGNRDHGCEALRKEFVNEFQRTREIAHKLVDNLTAISGYVEIMMMRAGPEQRIFRAPENPRSREEMDGTLARLHLEFARTGTETFITQRKLEAIRVLLSVAPRR